jgi:hypothetical protein
MTMMLAAITVIVAAQSADATAANRDPCSKFVPQALHSAIAGSYVGYRLVQVSDYDSDTIASERQFHKGSACLGVAAVDATGDGRKDYCFLLTSPTRHTLLVVALSGSRRRPWRLATLHDFGGEGTGGSFQNTIEPGKYVDLFATDRAPDEYVAEQGRVRRYTSRRSGFVAGTIESSAIAFFYTGKRWVHLWLSD